MITVRSLLLLITSIAAVAPCRAADTPPATSDVEARAALDAVILRHEDDVAVAAFARRVALVEEVAARLRECIEAGGEAALDEMLAEVADDTPAPVVPTFTQAAEIYFTYAEPFAVPLRVPEIPSEDLAALRLCYDRFVRAVTARIAVQGEALIQVDPPRRGSVAGLCYVLPFLQVPDGAWSQQAVEQMPGWLRDPVLMPLLERAAIHLRRPRSAHMFHHLARQPAGSDVDATTYRDYLHRVAVAQEKSGNVLIALAFLRTAVEVGLALRDAAQDTVWFDLARLYDIGGHPKLAAEQMQGMIERSTPAVAVRARLFRLKYLYRAGDDVRVVAETDLPSAEASRPERLYFRWAALRRLERLEESDRVAASFFDAHATHPLAADVYFGQAISALAAGEHQKTLDLLEIIEVRFPDAPMIHRVREIRSRLNADATGPSTAIGPMP